MDLLKPILAASLTALVVTLVGVSIIDAPQGPAGQNGKDGETFGALAGPDIPSNWIRVGGVEYYAQSAPLTQGASTTCALQGPSATSTLVSAGIRFDTASSSAIKVELGRDNTAYATTTLLSGVYSIAANARATIIASTTPTGGDAVLFSPNQWFTAKIGSGSTNSAPVGYCYAEWRVFR